MARTMIIQ